MNISLKKQFEKELKNKLALKASGHTLEENVLLKAFKYFDLGNTGFCTPKTFLQTIYKIGITGLTEENILNLFNQYDTEKKGELDYKKFIGLLYYNQSIINEDRIDSKKIEVPKPNMYTGQVDTDDNSSYQSNQNKNYKISNKKNDDYSLIDIIRENLLKKGLRGLISMESSFRLADKDNSQSVNIDDFKKIALSYKFGLNDEEIFNVFELFDKENTGKINYDEFIRNVRGPMSEKRKKIVAKAFDYLDYQHKGQLLLNDINDYYNAKDHPFVLNGKKNEEEVLQEFLDTFFANHMYLNGDEGAEGIVDLEEFIDYYESVSCTIDDDDLFEEIIYNVWNIDNGQTQNIKNDNQNDNEYDKVDNNNLNNNNNYINNNSLNLFREYIINLGAKSLIGLVRQFKLFDDNKNNTLDYTEFSKAFKASNLNIPDNEIKNLFQMFDTNNTGYIDYIEFLGELVGDLNERRKNVILAAFSKLDLDKSGIVELNEVKNLFNTRNNPLVLNGEKNEEEIYSEFIETFQIHHNITSGIKNKRVTLDEFLNYYKYISVLIPDDDLFEAIIISNWKLGDYNLKKQDRKIEGNNNLLNQKLNKLNNPNYKSNIPFGVDDEPVNYTTSNNNYNKNITFKSKKNPQIINEDPLDILRKKLKERGTRGIMSLRRTFMINDINNTHTTNLNQFQKYLLNYRIDIPKNQINQIFNLFDNNRKGEIDYEIFTQNLIGDMNDYRKNIVKKIFQNLDVNNENIINLMDVRLCYNASKHPEVLSGKKTEQEKLSEFLDSIDYHFNLLNQNRVEGDEKVSLEEFLDYYNIISFLIEKDEDFNEMMCNVWGLESGNRRNYRKNY